LSGSKGGVFFFFIEAIDLIRVLRTTADDKAAGQSHFQSQKIPAI
jgi:hypothetical protein